MNKLENKIRGNRELFDTFEPSSGHRERFRLRLDQPAPSLIARIPYGLKIAAVIALVAISSILIYEQGQRYFLGRQQVLQEILPPEYSEATIYYTSQIKEKYSEIERLSTMDPERREILLKELDEMDRLFNSLLKDLETNPSDERVLSAMITHYQMKLEIMGQIILQLEKANQINSTIKSHENAEV